MSDEAVKLANEYIQLGGASSPEDKDQYAQFDSNLKTIFYSTLLDAKDSCNLDILAKVDADFQATADPNPEVKQRWLPLCLSLKYQTDGAAYEASHDFVSSQGRLKYLTPLYQALDTNGQHDLAVEWFDENKDFYHPIALTSLEATLGLDTEDIQRLESFKMKVFSIKKNPRFRM